MPSWNIHIAHAQRLLEERGAAALGIRNEDAFLFGNILPDVCVGFLVEHPKRKVNYHDAHLAGRHHIPLPDADAFWDRYVEPAIATPDGAGARDAVLGAWCHLACDRTYNACARRLAQELGITPTDEFRIRKQHDFELFGRTLHATMRLTASPEVIAQAARFPQYEVVEEDVRAAVAVGNELLDTSEANHIEGVPSYRLLSAETFARAFDEAHTLLADRLCAL